LRQDGTQVGEATTIDTPTITITNEEPVISVDLSVGGSGSFTAED